MREKYVHGCRSEFSSACMSTTPAANKEVSVIMENGRVMSGIRRTGAEEKMCLRHLKAHC